MTYILILFRQHHTKLNAFFLFCFVCSLSWCTEQLFLLCMNGVMLQPLFKILCERRQERAAWWTCPPVDGSTHGQSDQWVAKWVFVFRRPLKFFSTAGTSNLNFYPITWRSNTNAIDYVSYLLYVKIFIDDENPWHCRHKPVNGPKKCEVLWTTLFLSLAGRLLWGDMDTYDWPIMTDSSASNL